ncbi:hypothetical protein RB195_018636 [Necator americanus]|uniref:Uncharacterized protein n=1 Tax=Necator americanus TaxID=51031 RepID=A0ABR1CC99_NECAM
MCRTTGDLSQKERLKRKLRHPLEPDRENESTFRAKKFGRVWKDKNPIEAYVLLRQYDGEMKRCSPDSTLPMESLSVCTPAYEGNISTPCR